MDNKTSIKSTPSNSAKRKKLKLTVIYLFRLKTWKIRRRVRELFRIGTAKPISASIKCSERKRVQRTSFSPSFIFSFYRPIFLSHVQFPPLNLFPSYERAHKHRVSRTKPDTGVASNFGRLYHRISLYLTMFTFFVPPSILFRLLDY